MVLCLHVSLLERWIFSSLSSLMKDGKAVCIGYSDRHLVGKLTSCIKPAFRFPEVLNPLSTCASAYSTQQSINLTGKTI